ncbi:hypothetical protein X777_13973 [Ooceraea biroi]|uniref:Secreted protein n=1 Tax=Ooceraea biroi TaxID=2015173 RepID=A0A026WY34_OOCBI|nr:hypothetical protein X777_13973 [Ooceraea biroi]
MVCIAKRMLHMNVIQKLLALTSVVFLRRLTRDAVVINCIAYRSDVSNAILVNTVRASSVISQSSSSHLIFKISFSSFSWYGLVGTMIIRSNKSIGIP